jgi:hypothetical protein
MSVTEPHLQLWHLSFDRTLETLWYPRKEVIGEPAHISVCPTIEQCVQSMYPGLGRFFKNYPALEYLIFHVYRPLGVSDTHLLTSDVLTQCSHVATAHITGEHWILEPVKMVHNGRVKVYRPRGFEQSEAYNTPRRGYFIYPTDTTIEWLDEV